MNFGIPTSNSNSQGKKQNNTPCIMFSSFLDNTFMRMSPSTPHSNLYITYRNKYTYFSMVYFWL